MLILARKPGESIVLDGGIRVVVVECDRRGVRLGIEAPAEVGIVRGEIVDAIAGENLRASASAVAARDYADLLPPPAGEEAA
ncbi:carbon storage regulator [Longimicrobium sp.]|uniref:carbon storage regulator n=1 Tax=Longimicrobium sp. TaxID=2029185 RepID=UPI002E33F5B6|nr:carbon storage regulator [Longimicrobium sp.]HEX6039231.1 carbon storage regulator [Longimicrobium sp.]